MTEQRILQALDVGEQQDWEFKSAQGGLPGSLWETYSAMANTDGGVIVLGVKEDGEQYAVLGLDNPRRMKSDFWNTINNRGKVSRNLLSDDDVSDVSVEGKDLLAVRVPRAGRRERPVYVGQNPIDGTYRRTFEGDYRCRPDEVGRMLADQSEDSFDGRILELFDIGDLDEPSVRQYRAEFSDRRPEHPWRDLDDLEFLRKIGAYRKDRQTGDRGITVAGLLMFGAEEAIRDPNAVPSFNLDYRERLSDDPAVRWTDRVTADGTWVCNLFQFFKRVIRLLLQDLKLPFEIETALLRRRDDTIVHEAIREALVNSLIHADYNGQGGVVVEKRRDRFVFSNPGTLLLDMEEVLAGGVSECRNKSLQAMFTHWGYGERAGSGMDKIRGGWDAQQWRSPILRENFRPDRVNLTMSMVSLLPHESVECLREWFGADFDTLSAIEIQALVTAHIEGEVSNSRLRQVCDEHPADITKLLQGLVVKGLLEQHGAKRGTTYELPILSVGPDPTHNGPVTSHGGPVTSHNGPVTSHNGPVTSHNGPDIQHSRLIDNLAVLNPDEVAQLTTIAEPATSNARIAADQTRDIILGLCHGRSLTAEVLAHLLNRNPAGLRSRFLTPMVREGTLRHMYPDHPRKRGQAYTIGAPANDAAPDDDADDGSKQSPLPGPQWGCGFGL